MRLMLMLLENLNFLSFSHIWQYFYSIWETVLKEHFKIYRFKNCNGLFNFKKGFRNMRPMYMLQQKS